jgi:hypothetical protein
MDQIARRREERRCELARDFLAIFDNGEDAILAATMLVMAVASPVNEEDRARYLAALEQLPKGSAAKPRLGYVSPDIAGATWRWRVTFADHHAEYQSLRHFPTKAEADDYASDFVVRLRGEINRP